MIGIKDKKIVIKSGDAGTGRDIVRMVVVACKLIDWVKNRMRRANGRLLEGCVVPRGKVRVKKEGARQSAGKRNCFDRNVPSARRLPII